MLLLFYNAFINYNIIECSTRPLVKKHKNNIFFLATYSTWKTISIPIVEIVP